MIDLALLSHIQPGSISERGLKQGQERTLQNDFEYFLIGLPLFRGQEIGTDVNQVLYLLVPHLLVLKVLNHIEGLTHFA